MFSNKIKQFLICVTSASAGFVLTKLLCDYSSYNKTPKNHINIQHKEIPEDFLREELKRNYEFFGNDSMIQLQKSYVIVIGVGSLGSHVVMALIRSGIKQITIIDNGFIRFESLACNAFASHSDIGKAKIDIIKSYALAINPSIKINALFQEFSLLNDSSIFYDSKSDSNAPDYIIDCLGDCNIELKSHLINLTTCKEFKEKKIKVITTMDYKDRYDPSKVRLVPFNFVSNNTFAKRLMILHKEKNNKAIPSIDTVYSIEEPSTTNSTVSKDKINNCSYFCLPAAYGQCISSRIICNLTNFNNEKEYIKFNETNPISSSTNSHSHQQQNQNNKKSFEKQIVKFEKKEGKSIPEYTNDQRLFTYEHYDTIMKSFNNQSSISKKKNQKLRLALWRPFKQLTIDNIILGTKEEIIKHGSIKTEEELNAFYSKDTIERIEQVLSSIRTNYTYKK